MVSVLTKITEECEAFLVRIVLDYFTSASLVCQNVAKIQPKKSFCCLKRDRALLLNSYFFLILKFFCNLYIQKY